MKFLLVEDACLLALSVMHMHFTGGNRNRKLVRLSLA